MTECLICGHDLSSHVIHVYGKYDELKVNCDEMGEDVHDSCDCAAGFKRVKIKKEFISE